MENRDSKKLWLSVEGKMCPQPMKLGRYTAEAYQLDPIRLSFITSRYKFCARLLTGLERVLEIGCGDGFGSGIVAHMVEHLVATDINEDLLADNRERMNHVKNISFEYFDFREKPYPEPMDGIYLIDTIEHIYPEEEPLFMGHIASSLKGDGICIIGTPNTTADRYANKWSREGHVNMKDHNGLMALARAYFHRAFFFGMNDEVVHTGFPPMAHFMWALCVNPKST